MDDGLKGCLAVLLFFAMLSTMSFGCVMAGRNSVKQEAIEHHAAEYRVDPKTGQTTFVWLTDEAEKETTE